MKKTIPLGSRKAGGLVLALALSLASMSLAVEDIWTRKADMPTARLGFSTSVVDGKIYAIGGGYNIEGPHSRIVEEYDPVTDTWTRKADMPTGRIGHAASVVNGKIYVIGGDLRREVSGPTVEEYDPATDTWTRKADMPTKRTFLCTCAVDGKIYAIGGITAPAMHMLSTVEVYDPATDTWTKKDDMPTPRWTAAVSAVDGKIYAVGGTRNNVLRTVEEYDPATDTWTSKADMPTARASLCTSVANGKVYAIGGASGMTGPVLKTVEEYDPITDAWTIKADMPTARWFFSTSALNGKIYAIGGSVRYPPHDSISTVEEYDPGLIVTPPPDFNGDGIVNLMDFSKLAQYWFQDESSVDIAPPPFGDGMIDFKDLAVLSEHWLQEYTEVVYIQWLGHSTVKIWTEDCVVYVDPERLSESLHDATLVCVTHTHGDHYSPSDIARVSNPDTQFIAPPDVIQRYGSGESIAPGQTIDFDFVSVTAVPAYNTNKPNHPKANNWVGYIIEIASKRIYVAGDTDLIEEMKTLGRIDVAILPAGGTYTMNAAEAAEATGYIKPLLAIPYHWGQNVGTLSDAERFEEMADCNVKIMSLGEILSSEDWLKDFSMIAHWKLDETEGFIAHDTAGSNDGTVHGDPLWQPAGGKINGALQFDGIDDYVSTPLILNPTDGAFSVFVWIKGGTPGQVIVSQTNGTGIGKSWLCTDPSDGKLMTMLTSPPGRSAAPPPLLSEFVVTDGNWHHLGFVWDGAYRCLYVDDIEVAKDTKSLTMLESADGGLHIGAGKTLDAASFFTGLVDDVRIYDEALSAEKIEELAR